jgi:LPS export ABC transporter protein LptC
LIVILLFFLSSVLQGAPISTTQEGKREVENGKPLMESTDVEILYSSQGIVLTKIYTAQMVQYENGDKFCPAGMYATCYDKEKKIIGTLRANTVYHYANSDLWELKGDVEVKGYYKGEDQQLNTEELYWNLKTKEIYTDSFIRLETPNELLTGKGFQALQDLSYYTLAMPEGYIGADESNWKQNESEK